MKKREWIAWGLVVALIIVLITVLIQPKPTDHTAEANQAILRADSSIGIAAMWKDKFDALQKQKDNVVISPKPVYHAPAILHNPSPDSVGIWLYSAIHSEDSL